MFHPTADAWRRADRRRVMVFGMSGLGKTRLAGLLRDSGGWFHYSVDYRIGTRYMGEHIADEFKRAAMQVPLLRELLLSDSVRIRSNITFENLAPLSLYLGKPGDPGRGGLPMAAYMERQRQHREAEIAAMLDTLHFIDRAESIYGYGNFICDTSGSICEVVEPENPDDPVLKALAPHLLPVWIEGSQAHTDALVRRFDRAPKPMYYNPDFLAAAWADYLAETGLTEATVDPDAFVRWTYARALGHRAPRYAAIARHWGVSVSAADIARVERAEEFVALVALALERRACAPM